MKKHSDWYVSSIERTSKIGSLDSLLKGKPIQSDFAKKDLLEKIEKGKVDVEDVIGKLGKPRAGYPLAAAETLFYCYYQKALNEAWDGDSVPKMEICDFVDVCRSCGEEIMLPFCELWVPSVLKRRVEGKSVDKTVFFLMPLLVDVLAFAIKEKSFLLQMVLQLMRKVLAMGESKPHAVRYFVDFFDGLEVDEQNAALCAMVFEQLNDAVLKSKVDMETKLAFFFEELAFVADVFVMSPWMSKKCVQRMVVLAGFEPCKHIIAVCLINMLASSFLGDEECAAIIDVLEKYYVSGTACAYECSFLTLVLVDFMGSLKIKSLMGLAERHKKANKCVTNLFSVAHMPLDNFKVHPLHLQWLGSFRDMCTMWLSDSAAIKSWLAQVTQGCSAGITKHIAMLIRPFLLHSDTEVFAEVLELIAKMVKLSPMVSSFFLGPLSYAVELTKCDDLRSRMFAVLVACAHNKSNRKAIVSYFAPILSGDKMFIPRLNFAWTLFNIDKSMYGVLRHSLQTYKDSFGPEETFYMCDMLLKLDPNYTKQEMNIIVKLLRNDAHPEYQAYGLEILSFMCTTVIISFEDMWGSKIVKDVLTKKDKHPCIMAAYISILGAFFSSVKNRMEEEPGYAGTEETKVRLDAALKDVLHALGHKNKHVKKSALSALVIFLSYPMPLLPYSQVMEDLLDKCPRLLMNVFASLAFDEQSCKLVTAILNSLTESEANVRAGDFGNMKEEIFVQKAVESQESPLRDIVGALFDKNIECIKANANTLFLNPKNKDLLLKAYVLAVLHKCDTTGFALCEQIFVGAKNVPLAVFENIIDNEHTTTEGLFEIESLASLIAHCIDESSSGEALIAAFVVMLSEKLAQTRSVVRVNAVTFATALLLAAPKARKELLDVVVGIFMKDCTPEESRQMFFTKFLPSTSRSMGLPPSVVRALAVFMATFLTVDGEPKNMFTYLNSAVVPLASMVVDGPSEDNIWMYDVLLVLLENIIRSDNVKDVVKVSKFVRVMEQVEENAFGEVVAEKVVEAFAVIQKLSGIGSPCRALRLYSAKGTFDMDQLYTLSDEWNEDPSYMLSVCEAIAKSESNVVATDKDRFCDFVENDVLKRIGEMLEDQNQHSVLQKCLCALVSHTAKPIFRLRGKFYTELFGIVEKALPTLVASKNMESVSLALSFSSIAFANINSICEGPGEAADGLNALRAANAFGHTRYTKILVQILFASFGGDALVKELIERHLDQELERYAETVPEDELVDYLRSIVVFDICPLYGQIDLFEPLVQAKNLPQFLPWGLIMESLLENGKKSVLAQIKVMEFVRKHVDIAVTMHSKPKTPHFVVAEKCCAFFRSLARSKEYDLIGNALAHLEIEDAFFGTLQACAKFSVETFGIVMRAVIDRGECDKLTMRVLKLCEDVVKESESVFGLQNEVGLPLNDFLAQGAPPAASLTDTASMHVRVLEYVHRCMWLIESKSGKGDDFKEHVNMFFVKPNVDGLLFNVMRAMVLYDMKETGINDVVWMRRGIANLAGQDCQSIGQCSLCAKYVSVKLAQCLKSQEDGMAFFRDVMDFMRVQDVAIQPMFFVMDIFHAAKMRSAQKSIIFGSEGERLLVHKPESKALSFLPSSSKSIPYSSGWTFMCGVYRMAQEDEEFREYLRDLSCDGRITSASLFRHIFKF